VKIIEILVKTCFSILGFNPVSLLKSIIEREATFENSSDIEVKVTQNKSARAFVKDTQ